MTTNDSTAVPLAVLENVLRVSVENFEAWRERNKTAELHLFLAGAELKNVVAVWTVVLVVVFIYAVYDNVLMPVFDTTLLGLMGISSGTYLGFKFPEKAT